MATFTITNIRERAKRVTKPLYSANRFAASILNETVKAQSISKTYDIFLSHSSNDSEIILGVKLKLEDYGYSVYIDWIDDPMLDRTNVTPETAKKLRQRMNSCESLFYVTTPSSSESKWMPWECGYFDGKKNRTAILPVTDYGSNTYNGHEYLGIYPYITEDTIQGSSNKILWVNKSFDIYCKYDNWLKGHEPSKH